MAKFQSRKQLLKMDVGDELFVPVSKCLYKNLKTTTHQLKTMGLGEWLCTKKGGWGDSFTSVTRIK